RRPKCRTGDRHRRHQHGDPASAQGLGKSAPSGVVMPAFLSRLLVVLTLVFTATAARAAPLEAYGKLPSIEAVSLSPNGQELAFVVTNGEQRQIVVRELASGKILLRGLTGQVKVRGVQWAGDKHLIIVSSATRNAWGFIDGWGEWFFASIVD